MVQSSSTVQGNPSRTDVEIESSFPASHTEINVESQKVHRKKHHRKHKKGGFSGNIFRGVGKLGSVLRKYAYGTTQFFGTGAKEAVGAAVNLLGDAGIGMASVVGTTIGDSAVGKEVTGVISGVKDGLIHAGDGIVNDAECILTGLVGKVGNGVDQVADIVDQSTKTVGSSYYSAFSSNTGRYLRKKKCQ